MSAIPSPPSVASTTDAEETDDSASVTDSVASSVETFTCHTAPGVVFTSRAELSDHYRSDWHRYNLKRKVAQLPPVAREEFDRRRAEALAHADNSKPKQQQHLKKNKKRGGGGSKAGNPRASGQSATAGGAPRAAGVAAAAADTTAQDAGDGGAEESKGETDEPTTQASRNDAGVTLRTIFQGMAAGLTAEELAEGGHDFDWDALEQQYAQAQQQLDVTQSFFDNHQSADIHANLQYMQRKFGFFIPDAEYVDDLDGLVRYMAAKVKLGCVCLYCGRTFKGARECQQHMIDTYHCKLRYEDDNDFEEIMDFYDYSASYAGMAGEDGEDGEDGEEGEEGEDGGWETCSDDEDGEGPGKEDDDGGDGSGSTAHKTARSTTLVAADPSRQRLAAAFARGRRVRRDADTDELVLMDGKRVGHRDYRRYFKQRYRPEDTRESTMAERREHKERLLIMYKAAGVETSSALAKQRALAPALMPKKWKQQQKRDERTRDRHLLRVGMTNFKNNPNPLKPNDSGYVT